MESAKLQEVLFYLSLLASLKTAPELFFCSNLADDLGYSKPGAFQRRSGGAALQGRGQRPHVLPAGPRELVLRARLQQRQLSGSPACRFTRQSPYGDKFSVQQSALNLPEPWAPSGRGRGRAAALGAGSGSQKLLAASRLRLLPLKWQLPGESLVLVCPHERASQPGAVWLRRPGQSWSMGPAVPAPRDAARTARVALGPLQRVLGKGSSRSPPETAPP